MTSEYLELRSEFERLKEKMSSFEHKINALDGRQDRTESEVSYIIETLEGISAREELRDQKLDRVSGEVHEVRSVVRMIRESQDSQNDGIMRVLNKLDESMKYMIARIGSGGDVPWTPSR